MDALTLAGTASILIDHASGATTDRPALAQMERRLLSERTLAGLAAARARGHVGGRPTVVTGERLEAARAMRANGATYTAIASALDIGPLPCADTLVNPT